LEVSDFIRAKIVVDYVWAEGMLSSIIGRHFFYSNSKLTINSAKATLFENYVLEEKYIPGRLALVRQVN
jgi:hypothetical protein